MMATAYMADINRGNLGYIYDQSYRQVRPPHDAEYIFSHRFRHWSRDWVMDYIGLILEINRRKWLY